MPLVKCPRCELNYMDSTEKVCAVCKREMRGEEEHDTVELCANCGERLALPGEDLCAVCLKELNHSETFADDGTSDPSDAPPIDIHAVEVEPDDSMDIDLDITDDDTVPDSEFAVIKKELGGDDDEFSSISLDEAVEAENAADDEDEDD